MCVFKCSGVFSIRAQRQANTQEKFNSYIFHLYSSKFKDFGKNPDIFLKNAKLYSILTKPQIVYYKNVKFLNNESNSVKNRPIVRPSIAHVTVI